jgi:hypothetical protein
MVIVSVVNTVRAEWPAAVEGTLVTAKENRSVLEGVLKECPEEQRPGLVFLLTHMPASDATTLTAELLKENHEYAYKARAEFAWCKALPEAIYFNNVLPYVNLDETREPWRKKLYELCQPMVKDCKTATEAVMKLNAELFPKLKVGYSTQRRAPNQAPEETIASGKASCTGLSILLSDACRSVGIATRIVGTPLWANKRGNHTWLEIYDEDWHFLGACEPDPKGLDRGWFVGDAAQATSDKPEHAIYASSYAKTETHFPLVWAPRSKAVHGVDVTARYAKKDAVKADAVRVLIRVVDADNKRVKTAVQVKHKADPTKKYEGTSRSESADTNDFLTFDLLPDTEFILGAGQSETRFKTEQGGKTQLVELVLPRREK